MQIGLNSLVCVCISDAQLLKNLHKGQELCLQVRTGGVFTLVLRYLGRVVGVYIHSLEGLIGLYELPDAVEEVNLYSLVGLEEHVVVVDQEWLQLFLEVEGGWAECSLNLLKKIIVEG